MQRVTGLGSSPGIAIGRAILMPRSSGGDVCVRIARDAIPQELERLETAIGHTREQLDDIRRRVERTAGAGHAYLFDAQLLMLEDPMLVRRAEQMIRTEHINAEWALQRAGNDLGVLLGAADDAYLRERGGDVSDVVSRLRTNLRQRDPKPELSMSLEAFDSPAILVTDELPASVAAQLDWTRISGFVAERGSRTQHTSILARSLHVPAVVGLPRATETIAPGMMVIVDGSTGQVVIEPTEAARQDAMARQARYEAAERSLGALRSLPAETEDGVRVTLLANLERPEELVRAREYGAEGIGLFRSEFLMAGGSADEATEDEQYEIYRTVVERMAPEPVTIRSFDGSTGEGTLRGLRASRASARGRERLLVQLAALCRAAAHGRLRVMFPLLASLEELREAKELLAEARRSLVKRCLSTPDVQVGVMIEVPSAAMTADLLAPEVDFFSIGTNDLVHYALAVDRADDRVSNLYEPLHPAVLRMLRQIRQAAADAHRPVAVCGEMAADPTMLPLLVGLGFTELSMTPAAIPLAKHVIRRLRASEACAMTEQALGCGTVLEIEAVLARARPVLAGERS